MSTSTIGNAALPANATKSVAVTGPLADPREAEQRAAGPVDTADVAPRRAGRPDPEGYSGPKDGECHFDGKWARVLFPLGRFGVRLTVRQHVEGAENIPKSGPHMLCFTHQSLYDPPIVSMMAGLNYRYMAAKEQFFGVQGWAMTKMGAFPVDRDAHARRPIDVSVRSLNGGNGLCIFPEGGIYHEQTVHPLKSGAPTIALMSECQSLVPGAMVYREHQSSLLETLLHYGAAAAVTVGTGLLATHGGPIGSVAGCVIGGAAAGLIGGGVTGFIRNRRMRDTQKQALAIARSAVIGAAAGAVTAGIGGGLLGAHAGWLGGPLTAAVGAVSLVVAQALNARPDVYVKVAPGIDTAPYRTMPLSEGRDRLTADLYAHMVALRSDLDARYPPESKP